MATQWDGRGRYDGSARLGRHVLMRAVDGASIGVAARGAGKVGLFGVAEGEPGVVRAQVQGVGHRDVGGRESVTGHVRRVGKLPPHEQQPSLNALSRPARTPIVPFRLGCDEAANQRDHDQRRQARLAQMEELLVSGEGRIVGARAAAA